MGVLVKQTVGGNMTIELIIKNVFGNELVYPSCIQGKMLASFKGTKTFSDLDLNLLKKLGYKFEWVALKREV
jgi:hypothetical protein